MWNNANEDYFEMTFPDKLEELKRSSDILKVEVFSRETVSVMKMATEMCKRGLSFSLKPDSVRVDLATHETLSSFKPGWDLLLDMSANDIVSDLVQSATFQHGIKTTQNNEKTAVYWYLKRLVDFKFYSPNKTKPSATEMAYIGYCLELAINQAHRFCVDFKKKFPDINEPLEKIWKLVNDLLSRNVVNDELNQNAGTITMNSDLASVITDIGKDRNASILQYLYEVEDKNEYDNPIQNYEVIKTMDLFNEDALPVSVQFTQKRVNAKRKALVIEQTEQTAQPSEPVKKTKSKSTKVVQNKDLVAEVESKHTEVVDVVHEDAQDDSQENAAAELIQLATAHATELDEDFKARVTFANKSANDFYDEIKETHRNKVDIICLDPPYNILGIERDQWSSTDINTVVERAYHLLRQKGFIVVFTSWQLAGSWYSAFLGSNNFTPFKSLLNVAKHHSYGFRPSGCSNMNSMVEYAVVAYKKGTGRVAFNYAGVQTFVEGQYGRGANVIEGYIPPAIKLKYKGKTLRVEEKSSGLYMEILTRFADPGSLVLDLYAGTASSAYAALKLGMKWIGCEIDENVHASAMERLLSQFDYLRRGSQLPQIGSPKPIEYKAPKTIPTSNYPINVIEHILVDDSCNQILMAECKELGLEVKPTKIAGMSNIEEGLFAHKPFKAGDEISSYWGKILGEKEHFALEKDGQLGNRCVMIPRKFSNKKYYVNGDLSCPAVYINCCVDLEGKKMLIPNAELNQSPDLSDVYGLADHDVLMVNAIRDIEEGEEILINYVQSDKYEDVCKWFNGVHDISFNPKGKQDSLIPMSTAVATNVISVDDDIPPPPDLVDIAELDEAETRRIDLSTDYAAALKDLEGDALLIAQLLWERYTKLGLLDYGKMGQDALDIIKGLNGILQETLAVIRDCILAEPNDKIAYDNRNWYVVHNIIKDTEANRAHAKKIIEYSKTKHIETINDQNYGDSKGRKMFRFENKHHELFEFIHHLDVACRYLWPEYNLTTNTLMWTLENTERQGFHTDYNTFGKGFELMSYASILALDDDCYLWVAKVLDNERVFERIYYPFGSIVFFTGNQIHAGDGFTSLNCCRLHRYIESPKMIHGVLVNQDYHSYASITLELNKHR